MTALFPPHRQIRAARFIICFLGVCAIAPAEDSARGEGTAPAAASGGLAAERDGSLSPMRSIIEHDTSDREALDRRYDGELSESGRQRMGQFYESELAKLKASHFESLDQGGRI